MIIKNYKGYDIEATVVEVRELLGIAPDRGEVIQGPMADPEPEPEKPKKSNKKMELDMGKVKALRAAGRTVEWIADDMKVSPATIYKRLKEEGEMQC